MFKYGLIAIALISTIIIGNSIGIVYGVSGPIAGVYIYAEPSIKSGTGSSFAKTDNSGYYSMTTGLTAGTYNLTAFAYGYISSNIGPITVIPGQTTMGINIFLKASGGISGKVTDAVNGNPINGTLIYASPLSKVETFGFPIPTTTGSDGSYLIATDLPTGTYNVSVLLPTGYIGKMTTASVVAGVETKNVNLQLARSGIISGKVSAPNGTGLYGISVTALGKGNPPYFGYAITDVSGNYRIITGLGTGTYTIYASGAGSYATYSKESTYSGYSFFTPTPISVTAGQETSNINIQLTPIKTSTPSGTISGRITDTSSNPIRFAEVTTMGSSGTGLGETDKNGYYIISEGLATGNDYNVSVKSSGYYDASYPTLVSVKVGQITSNINIQMIAKPEESFGTITGTVTGDTNIIQKVSSSFMGMVSLPLTSLVVTVMLKTKKHKSKDNS